MSQGLVDTHAHLMDASFDVDRARVLERAAEAGVSALLVVGYDLPSSRAAVELARAHPHIRAAVGIHPNAAAEASQADFEAIADLARDDVVIAIGETGLDNFRTYTPPARQREALSWHLQLAAELDLPVVIHNRQADADIAARACRPRPWPLDARRPALLQLHRPALSGCSCSRLATACRSPAP